MKPELSLVARPPSTTNPSINRPKINSFAFATYSVLIFLGQCAISSAHQNATEEQENRPFSFKACKQGFTSSECSSDIGGAILIGISAVAIAICASLMAIFTAKKIARAPIDQLESQHETEFIEHARTNPNLYSEVTDLVRAPIPEPKTSKDEDQISYESIEASFSLAETTPLVMSRGASNYL